MTDFKASFVAIPPGEYLRACCKRAHMQHKVLADKLGISTKHMSNVMTGKAPVSIDLAARLETAFGIPAAWWGGLEYEYRTRLEKGGVHWNAVMDHYMGDGVLRVEQEIAAEPEIDEGTDA